MAHRIGRGPRIVGTDGDDHFQVGAPAAIDGGDGFDTLHLDFSASQIGIRMDLSALWSGGSGWLNGHRIVNVEAIGPSTMGAPVENADVVGSEQDDVLILGADYLQRTVLYGLGGDDVLVGGDGDSAATGASNYLAGGAGDDRVVGGARPDDLVGEEGDDRLEGEGGDDLLFGDAGRDRLLGGAGGDYLRGGAGDDGLSGGAGDDRIDGSLGADRLDGGAGADTAEYYGAEAGVVVDLALGLALEDGRLDRLVSIEHAAGSFLADLLLGSGGANRLLGDGGDDVLRGRGGADWLEGGAGADLFLFDDGDFGGDVIADFDSEGDRMDLSAVDARAGAGDDAFLFLGEAAFTGTAGELRVAAGEEGWRIEGDRNGDALADFSILVVAPLPPAAGDFVL